MCELLWSDPQAPNGRSPSKRGVGVAFGPDVTRRFLEANGLQLLVRSHEARPQLWGQATGWGAAHALRCSLINNSVELPGGRRPAAPRAQPRGAPLPVGLGGRLGSSSRLRFVVELCVRCSMALAGSPEGLQPIVTSHKKGFGLC